VRALILTPPKKGVSTAPHFRGDLLAQGRAQSVAVQVPTSDQVD